MRSTVRLFLVAILLTTAAGIASAQDASAAPPPSAPEVAKPVAELPPIPFAKTFAPAVVPAAPVTADLPPAEKPATTTSERAKKRITTEPAENASIQVTESFDAPTAAASTAALDTAADRPPDAAAPPKSIAPPLPPFQAAAVEPGSEETKSQNGTGVGGWLLAGIAAAGLFSIISLIRGRRTRRPASVEDLTTVSPELEPAVVRVHNSND